MSERDLKIRVTSDGFPATIKQLEQARAALVEMRKGAVIGSAEYNKLGDSLVHVKEQLALTSKAVTTENGRMMNSYFALGEKIRSAIVAYHELAIAIAGAHVLVGLAEKSAVAEDGIIALDRVMKQFGKNTFEELEKVKIASAGLIDDSDIARLMTRAVRLGVPIKDLAVLMEIARVKFRDFGREGETVADMFGRITEAIGRGTPKQLVALGLIDKFDDSVKNLKSDAEENDGSIAGLAIRHQLLQRVLDNGTKSMTGFNKELLTNSERIQQVKVKIQEAQEWIGGFVIRLGFSVIAMAGTLRDYINVWIGRIIDMFVFLENAMNKVYAFMGMEQRTVFKQMAEDFAVTAAKSRKETLEWYTLAKKTNKEIMNELNAGASPSGMGGGSENKPLDNSKTQDALFKIEQRRQQLEKEGREYQWQQAEEIAQIKEEAEKRNLKRTEDNLRNAMNAYNSIFFDPLRAGFDSVISGSSQMADGFGQALKKMIIQLSEFAAFSALLSIATGIPFLSFFSSMAGINFSGVGGSVTSGIVNAPKMPPPLSIPPIGSGGLSGKVSRSSLASMSGASGGRHGGLRVTVEGKIGHDVIWLSGNRYIANKNATKM